MNIEMLISTMNQENLYFLNDMNIKTNAVIINQVTKPELCLPKNLENDKVKFISLNEKGLSKSRNKAIENSTADICVICDDDMRYLDGHEKIILNEYQQNPEIDVIVFQVKKSDGSLYKKYFKKKKKLNRISAMKVSSVEITFKKESIDGAGIRYNELFGAGSKFFMGEESIFLNECIKKGLKILFVPRTIGYLRNSESSWFEGYDRNYFLVKGACFYKMSRTFFVFFILQFAVRKYKFYKEYMGLFRALKTMYKGKKEYLQMIG